MSDLDPRAVSPSVVAELALAARRWRFVGLVLATYVAGAVWVHQTILGAVPYTWTRPLEGARDVAHQEYFLTCALIVFLAARGGGPSLATLRTHAHDDARRHLGAALRMLLAGLVAAFAASRFSASYAATDLIAAFAFGAGVAWDSDALRRWVRTFLPTTVWTLGALCLVAYGFTVYKAALFVVAHPHDAAIVRFETAIFGTDPSVVAATFAVAHPGLVAAADWVYFRSFEHVLLQVVFLAALDDKRARGRYIAAMSLCYVFGSVGYLLLPSVGPVFAYPSQYDYLARWAPVTHTFRELLTKHVSEFVGGHATRLVSFEYIAGLPSLHIAQEFLITVYSRASRWVFAASLVFLVATLGAVVLLGWHSVSDCVAGIGIAVLAVATASRLARAGERNDA